MNTTIDTTDTTDLALAHADVFSERQAQLSFTAAWFRELQSTHWQRYLDLPRPTRMNENWRFASLSYLDEVPSFIPAPLRGIDLDGIEERAERLNEVSGRLTFVDDNLGAARFMDKQVEAQGVIFTTLIEALARYPDLVKEYFLKHSPDLGSDKYESLHVAMLRCGVFLYVPDGVKVEKPFVVNYFAEQDGHALFPHTLFVCGNSAKATLLEFQESLHSQHRSLIVANAHVIAGDNAEPAHDIMQNWSRSSISFQLNTNTVGTETNARGLIINLGSSKARQEVHGRILGSGSNVEMYSLNVPRGDQDFDQRTLQTHVAPNSRSDLLYKSALSDKTRTIFSGLIIVEQNAQQTDAYQKNNNLMLSDDAEANSLPGLEIGANDVKCSHGATCGRIDDSEIFYFLSRGIPRRAAEELMVYGFFEEIIAKITNPAVAELFRNSVRNQFVAQID